MMTRAGESHDDRPACWVVRRRARARPGVLELSTARPAGPPRPGGSSPTTSTSSGWQARFTSTQPASPRSTRGCTNGLSGTSPHAPISAFREPGGGQAISLVRLSQFMRQTDLVGAVPLMLIWVAWMALWLSQGPAVSQANHGQRPGRTGNPVTVACSSLRPQKPGTVRIWGAFRTREADQSRADSLSHRQLRASATDGNYRSLATSQNLSVLAAALLGAFENAEWKGLLLALGIGFAVGGLVEAVRWRCADGGPERTPLISALQAPTRSSPDRRAPNTPEPH